MTYYQLLKAFNEASHRLDQLLEQASSFPKEKVSPELKDEWIIFL